jgi:hypothetical protein
MTKSAKNQMFVTRKKRFVLALFALAWLNVNAQPCLMAMELPEPADTVSEHSGHNGHHMAHEGAPIADDRDDCSHCPSADAQHPVACAAASASGCDDDKRIDIDARLFKLQPKDVPGFYALVHAPPVTLSFTPLSSTAPPTCLRPRFADGPSINLRNCVFLK